MKKLLMALIFLLPAVAPSVRADGPDDEYVGIYTLIQEGDTLNEKGQSASATAKYAEAQSALKRFQSAYPDAYVNVVKYRLNYLSQKISQLSSKAAPTGVRTNAVSAPPPSPRAAIPAVVPAAVPANTPSRKSAEPPAPVAPPPSAAAEIEIRDLRGQIRGIEADKALLQARLKEALSAQPAAMGPRELAKAQAQIRDLLKENELLKTSLASVKTNVSPANANVSPAVSANTARIQQALAESNRKVAQLMDANAILGMEKEALQIRVKALTGSDADAAALRDENNILKAQLAELKRKEGDGSQARDLSLKLKEAQVQLAALQSDKEILRLEKVALENRIKQTLPARVAVVPIVPAVPAPVPIAATKPATIPVAPTKVAAPPVAPTKATVVPIAPTKVAAVPAPGPVDSVTADKIARLEMQRDELQKSLDAATKDIYGRKKGRQFAERMDDMTRQLLGMRARIEIFEAHSVPYSSEELALFSGSPDLALMASVHKSAKAAREPSAKTAALLAEGRRYFAAHDLPKAEEKYLAALKLDPKNIVTLADLASIELELGRTAEAEKNLKASLAIEPDDDYSLFVLGQLKFQQKNYDEAFDALSRAAKINPQNARIQNFLGLTLGEKGQRGPAETAFRKAIQLDPGFAEAHMNLAVVYVTQQQPLVELARWHYQKAMAAGHAPNPGLEKLLNQAGGAPGAVR